MEDGIKFNPKELKGFFRKWLRLIIYCDDGALAQNNNNNKKTIHIYHRDVTLYNERVIENGANVNRIH